jgi:O-antigen/teichoic acid export membrane protein
MTNVNTTLKQLVRGAGILFLCTFLLYFTRFFYRLITSRYLGPEQYGLLSLGIMVLNIVGLLSVLGLHQGVIKYISHYNGKNDEPRVKGTILLSTKISLFISIISSTLLILFSKQIAINLFHNAAFRPVLIIFSLTVPFFSVHKILSKSFLAFKKPEYNLVSLLSREVTTLIILSIVILFSGNILHISLVTLISTIFALIISLLLMEKYVFTVTKKSIKPIYEYKKILGFSIPLFLSVVFIEIMGWADTFFLNFLRTSVEVGIYNVILPLAASLGVFSVAFSNMFFPIISELHTKKLLNEIKHTYMIAAKWIFLLTLPPALLFLFFPKIIISNLFGHEYIMGSSALVIIVIGYIISISMGPAFAILKTFNKVKFMFYINSIAAVLNVILNVILIPKFSIIGAAAATAFALIFRDIIFVLKARQSIKFKYKYKYYAKYILSGLISLIIVSLITRYLNITSIIGLIIILLCYGLTYLSLILVLHGIGKEDVMILLEIEKKLGINLGPIKNVILKFI